MKYIIYIYMKLFIYVIWLDVKFWKFSFLFENYTNSKQGRIFQREFRALSQTT